MGDVCGVLTLGILSPVPGADFFFFFFSSVILMRLIPLSPFLKKKLLNGFGMKIGKESEKNVIRT